jgi:hypothetical protein
VPVSDSWYARAAAQFRAHLSEFGMTFPPDQAERLIRERVEQVAVVMGMSVRSAQAYLDPASLAESVAATFQEERPGEDVLFLPRDVTLPVAVVARCVAALAEAINVRVRYEPAQEALTHIGNLNGPISALGQLTAAVTEDHLRHGVPLPKSLVLRIIRNLDVAAGIMDTADIGPGELASDGRAGAEQLAETFRRDANLLRLLSFDPEDPEDPEETDYPEDPEDPEDPGPGTAVPHPGPRPWPGGRLLVGGEVGGLPGPSRGDGRGGDRREGGVVEGISGVAGPVVVPGAQRGGVTDHHGGHAGVPERGVVGAVQVGPDGVNQPFEAPAGAGVTVVLVHDGGEAGLLGCGGPPPRDGGGVGPVHDQGDVAGRPAAADLRDQRWGGQAEPGREPGCGAPCRSSRRTPGSVPPRG